MHVKFETCSKGQAEIHLRQCYRFESTLAETNIEVVLHDLMIHLRATHAMDIDKRRVDTES